MRQNLTQFVDDEYWKSEEHTRHGWVPYYDLELGDRVYFIGLLGKVEAMTENNIPIVRGGVLGRLWQEKLPVRRSRYDAVKHITAHLIDCRSYAGFSGSPCYVQQSSFLQGTDRKLQHRARTALLGLIGGHFDDWTLTRDIDGADGSLSDTIEAPVSTGVGYVIPCEFIREVLMRDELVEVREREADEQQAASAGREDSNALPAAEPEWEN